MEAETIFVGILYAYPLALCAVRLISGLLVSSTHGNDHDRSSQRRSRYYNTIWYIQFGICVAMLANTIPCLRNFVEDLKHQRNDRTTEAYLASLLAVSLYFTAGLLPDPDGPFAPKPPNLHSWIAATAFELALIISSRFLGLQNDGRKSTADLQLAVGLVRVGFFLLMILAFLLAQERNFRDINEDTLERQSLVTNRAGNYTSYGVMKDGNSHPHTRQTSDAQSKGWVDYFVGFKDFFPYIWPSDSPKQQFTLFVCLLLLVAQRIVNILVPYQLGVLVEHLGEGKMPYKELLLYTLFRGLQGQQGVLGSIRAILWIPISQSLFRRLTCTAFEHVLCLSLDFHLSKRLGEVMSALNKGSALNTFLDAFAFQLFPMVFDLWVAAVYLFINFDAFYSIIVIGVMWSYISMTIYMAKYRGRKRRVMAQNERAMDASRTDALMAYETVHHNSAVQTEAAKFRNAVSNFQNAESGVLLSLNILNVTQNLVFILGVLLVLLLSAFQISITTHSVATFVSILVYFTQLHAPLAFFGSFYNQVQNNLVDAERMLELFKEKPAILDDPQATNLAGCTGRVRFEKVNFAYDRRKPALRDVTFTVEPGTSTAIVGESGSGKSTALKLLFRFYEVDSGNISIDFQDIRKIGLKSLRNHMGVVPQDTVLFNASVLENILYAKMDATLEDVYNACRTASIHDRILSFPDGYQTIVGERGLKLSGGEKQRIAIARAILKNPQIIFLDEATASLDSQTEKQIQAALEIITKGRTTLTIAHRLSTITNCDQILVFHDGQILERGTHEELLMAKGRYYNMWKKQTRGFKEQGEARGSGGT